MKGYETAEVIGAYKYGRYKNLLGKFACTVMSNDIIFATKDRQVNTTDHIV